MRKIKAIATVGIVIVVLGTGGFLAFDNFVAKKAKQNNQNQEAAKKESDKAANWKTYKTDYSFEFRYPQKWKIVDIKENNSILFFSENSIKKGVIIDREEILRGVDNSDMIISIDDNPDGLSVDSFYGKYDVAFKLKNNKKPREERIINGYKVTIFPFVESEDNPIFREAIIEMPNKFVNLLDTEPFDKEFDLILHSIAR
ncbi:hypothetical protein COS74_01005 [bacterium CG06_land_8_20_14_3_00_33_50]|nr:MAG: hypothetical protein COS74_01005 [bacterium CG06_land_8_20_14_3_00_33_50]